MFNNNVNQKLIGIIYEFFIISIDEMMPQAYNFNKETHMSQRRRDDKNG